MGFYSYNTNCTFIISHYSCLIIKHLCYFFYNFNSLLIYIMTSFLLSTIKHLPLELEDIIKSFIPISVLLTLNKQYYVKYHKHTKQIISKTQYDNYNYYDSNNNTMIINNKTIYNIFWNKLINIF
jgi:hypothetical protein